MSAFIRKCLGSFTDFRALSLVSERCKNYDLLLSSVKNEITYVCTYMQKGFFCAKCKFIKGENIYSLNIALNSSNLKKIFNRKLNWNSHTGCVVLVRMGSYFLQWKSEGITTMYFFNVDKCPFLQVCQKLINIVLKKDIEII